MCFSAHAAGVSGVPKQRYLIAEIAEGLRFLGPVWRISSRAFGALVRRSRMQRSYRRPSASLNKDAAGQPMPLFCVLYFGGCDKRMPYVVSLSPATLTIFDAGPSVPQTVKPATPRRPLGDVPRAVLDVLLAVHGAPAAARNPRPRRYVRVEGLPPGQERSGAIVLAVASGYLAGDRPLHSVSLTELARMVLRAAGRTA
jgi:hypothetical protein